MTKEATAGEPSALRFFDIEFRFSSGSGAAIAIANYRDPDPPQGNSCCSRGNHKSPGITSITLARRGGGIRVENHELTPKDTNGEGNRDARLAWEAGNFAFRLVDMMFFGVSTFGR